MRKLAGFISLVFILNLFVFPSQYIFATEAGPTILTNIGYTMKPNNTDPTPITSTSGVPTDGMFVYWDFSQYLTVLYTMTYPLPNGRVATLTVDRQNNVATVSFNLSGDFNSTYSSYSVYSNTENSYVNASDFINKNLSGTDPNYSVSDISNFPMPTFTITEGKGFSFRFDNTTVYFKWDTATKTFMYSTNNLPQGYIYPVELSIKPSNGNRKTSSLNIFNGISYETMNFTPTASGKIDPSNNNYSYKTAADTIYKNISTEDDDEPGTKLIGLIIDFKLPFIWNGSSFVSGSSVSMTNHLNSTLTLGNRDNRMAVEVSMKNIDSHLSINDDPTNGYSATVSPESGTFLVGGNISKSPRDPDTITITLTNMEPGLIFNESKLETSTSGTGLYYRSTIIPFGKVFTFPKYSIVKVGGNYYVRLIPYKGYWGDYVLRSGKQPSDLDPKSVQTDAVVITSDGNEDYIDFPVTLNEINQSAPFLKIYFSPLKSYENSITGSDYIYSQIFKYKETGESVLDVPLYFDVDNVSLNKPSNDQSGNTGEVSIRFSWDLGLKSTIEKLLGTDSLASNSLELEYTVAKNLLPEAYIGSGYDFVTIKLLITYDYDKKTPMVEYSVTDGNGHVTAPSGKVPLSDFRLETSADDRLKAQVTLQFDAKAKDFASTDLYTFEFPNVYFANIRPTGLNGKDSDMGLTSELDSFTLDYFSGLDVPPPQNLELIGGPYEEPSFDIRWEISETKLSEYVKNATAPISTYDSSNMPEFYMNLYISSDETYMREDFAFRDTSARINLSSFFIQKTPYDPLSITKNNFLNFSTTDTSLRGYLSPSDTSAYATAREALRNEKHVTVQLPISYEEATAIMTNPSLLPRTYTLEGLDKNQKYYITIDLVAKIKDIKDGNGNMIPLVSKLSNMIGVTTKGDKDIPTGQDIIPAAPKLRTENLQFGSVDLVWDAIPKTNANDVIEYEIIRLTDKQMQVLNLDSTDAFTDFWNNYLNDYVKLGLSAAGYNPVKVYDEASRTFVDAPTSLYEDVTKGTELRVTDKTLTPNTLYFYYIRTVKKDTNLRSSWSQATITTNPVDQPKNLVVELARSDYDPKTEVIISFDAPIPSMDQLGVMYDLQYQIKAEDSDWNDPVTMQPEILSSWAPSKTSEGLFHFLYKISGLKQSTSYLIRVRMIDKAGSTSLYTNTVQFRTQFDQEEHNQGQDIEDWSNYLELDLQDLLKDPYWITTDTTSMFEAMFRPSMWNNMIAQSTDSTILLPQAAAATVSYFIPASALEASNNAGKGFRIVHGNTEIILAPNSVDRNQNLAMAEIINKMNQNAIADYYLRITLTWADENERIDGNEAFGKSVNVRFELVGTKMLIKDWDSQVLASYQDFMKSYLSDPKVVNDFNTRVRGDSSNEALVRHVDDLKKQAKAAYLAQIASSHGNMVAASYEIDYLQRPVSVIAKGIDTSYIVRTYRKQATQWISIEHSPYGENVVIYTNTPGTFVFTGSLLNVAGINEMQNAGTLTRIITKYGLDEYFGKGGFNMQESASRLMVAGSVAKIMGAPGGADPYDWLSGNVKVTVSSRNMNAAISAQEAVYLIAALYESKSGINMETMQVRNYNATAYIQGLDDRYRVYVRAANELGIINADNFQPGSAISIKDVLQMIDAVDIMLKL